MATIIKRLVKGTPLTNAEGDANLDAFNTEKLERNGSIPMTGNLTTSGIVPISEANGLKIFNENDELVATFGAGNTKDIVVEGNINVGGEASGDLNLNGGDISVRNIYLSGQIISSQLGAQYKVSGDGETFQGTGENVSNKLVVTLDVILRLITIEGAFDSGQEIVGSVSATTGTVTKVLGNDIYVRLDDPAESFTIGETISYASNTGVLSVVIDSSTFEIGHEVKIFGASVPGSPTPIITPASSAAKIGAGSGFTYYYWIAQFNFNDGRISSATKISTGIVHKVASEFNEINNISLILNRTSASYGIVIYRATQDSIDQSVLIDVLGPGQLGGSASNISYIDYGSYSNTEWAGKDDFGNYTADSGIIHFPLSASATPLKGWVTATVESIDNTEQVTFDAEYEMNSGSSLEFVHINTTGLQQFINDQRDLNVKEANFSNGVYYTSKLKVPSNFKMTGSGKQTVFKQIPWNFEYWNDAVNPNEKGNIFVSEESAPFSVSFSNLTADGNFTNNARYAEANATYLINISNGENISFSDIQVVNSTGGGIRSYQCDYLRLQNCEILNGGGVSYLGNELSPFFSGGSRYLTVTNNLFENFLSPVDVSVTNIGTVIGNTVHNCGSGLLIYGSANLLSSPNLLMGPDNEYLPSPDTMDSDYNAVNISLDIGVDYISAAYLYMERGLVSYLGSGDRNSIPGTAVELTADIRMLTKLNNDEQLPVDYSETLGGTRFINFISADTGDYGRNNGYFQFKILGTDINEIPTLSELITENSGILVAGEQIMGLAYRVIGTTYTNTDVGERIAIQESIFSASGGDKFITITLSDPSQYATFVSGDTVKIFTHTSTPDINSTESVIVEKIVSGLARKLKIQLPAEVDLSGSVNGGVTGYVAIRKSFILAKGRIH